MDILWSPNHGDEFVTLGTDISLFKVENGVQSGQGLKLSDDTYANLLSVNSDNQYMKCIAWCPSSKADHLLAVGQANGKVVLTSFGRTGASDTTSLVGKEFVPRHARQCNYLEWNITESHLLAEGLDKYRTDCSILVWDVMSSHNSDIMEKTTDSYMVTKPLLELGSNGETSVSLAWFTNTPKTLVSGMNNKHIKIFDIRDTSRPQNVAITKAVNGVCIDPQCEHRLASFVENQVSIWDVRNFEKPLMTVHQPRPLALLSWCPTRSGLLGTLSRDSGVVQLFDVQHTNMGSDEIEPTVITRTVQSSGNHVVSSFAWHPQDENRMLTITPSGLVKDVKVFERICVNWSSEFTLTWTCGRSILQCKGQEGADPMQEDIASKMQQRALKNYGIQGNFDSCIEHVQNERHLVNMWSWFKLMKTLHAQNKVWSCTDGVRSLLTNEMTSSKDERCSHELYGQKFRPYRCYKSDNRLKALAMCNWGSSEDGSFDSMMNKMVDLGLYERAATLAVFNLKIPLALKVLKEGAKKRQRDDPEGAVNLNVVAMALSGFSDHSHTLWRDSCSELRTQLCQPYLNSMFCFLTCDNDDFIDVISECGMMIQDRVAFACRYLSDSKLLEFLDKLCKEMMDSGNLDGMLLTGISNEGIDLLQTYVDITGDVQSATLAVVNAKRPEMLKNPQVDRWIESYRSLLDKWQLWHKRAEFDVFHKSTTDGGSQVRQQLSVSCNFCGKGIAGTPSGANVRIRHFAPHCGASMNKPKISICPGCRKPLPRCALCLMHMGTASGSLHDQNSKSGLVKNDTSEKLAHFGDWFTWCQTCRHGGHATHIAEWFREHTECPVSGCVCKCVTLDTTVNSFSNISTLTMAKS